MTHHTFAQQLLQQVEACRRERTQGFDTTPRSDTPPEEDWGAAGSCIEAAHAHLREALPNGQLERTRGAVAALLHGTMSLVAWLQNAPVLKGGVPVGECVLRRDEDLLEGLGPQVFLDEASGHRMRRDLWYVASDSGSLYTAQGFQTAWHAAAWLARNWAEFNLANLSTEQMLARYVRWMEHDPKKGSHLREADAVNILFGGDLYYLYKEGT